MNAYIDALEVAIQQAARRQHRGRAKDPQRRRLVRVATAGVAAAVVVVLAVVAVLPGSKPEPASAASLPVFSRAAIDIAARAREMPQRVSAGFDLRHARSFATSKGTGYIVPSSDGASVCMVIPDPPAGYGGTCASVADVERRGLVGERVAPAAGAGRTEVMVLQPAAVPAPVLRDATGKTVNLEVHDGIATAIVTRPGTLTVAGHDGHQTLSVRPIEPQGEIVVDCGNGHFVKARDWQETTPDRRTALCARG
jgi:hypothetical protein